VFYQKLIKTIFFLKNNKQILKIVSMTTSEENFVLKKK